MTSRGGTHPAHAQAARSVHAGANKRNSRMRCAGVSACESWLPSLSVLVTCRVFDAMSAIFFHTGSTCRSFRSFVGVVYYSLALNMLNGLARF